MTQIISVVDNKLQFNTAEIEKQYNCKFLFDVYVGYQAGEEYNCYFICNVLFDTTNKKDWWQYKNNLFRSHKQGNVWITNINSVEDLNSVYRIKHPVGGNYAPKLAEILKFEYTFNKSYGLVESK